jgi:hypothetical protein
MQSNPTNPPADSPPEPDSQPQQRRDFGPLMDLDDLLAMAEIDETDVIEAMMWAEDNAPDKHKGLFE